MLMENFSVLINSGCSQSIVDADLCQSWKNARVAHPVKVVVSEWSPYLWTKAILLRLMFWWCMANCWGLTCYWDWCHKPLGGFVVWPTGSVQLSDRKVTVCSYLHQWTWFHHPVQSSEPSMEVVRGPCTGRTATEGFRISGSWKKSEVGSCHTR